MESYAVIKTGGKQYTVQTGEVIKVELLNDHQEGDTVELPTLVSSWEGELTLGSPECADRVKATVLGQERGDKIQIFKRKRRKTYRKKNGHRQTFQTIRIDSIPGS